MDKSKINERLDYVGYPELGDDIQVLKDVIKHLNDEIEQLKNDVWELQ
jgi:predicted  nucleic acid-binding Zn-ribbon protein